MAIQRRRKSPPLFELVRTGTLSTGRSLAPPAPPMREVEKSSLADTQTGWWSRAQRPIVWRLPVGLATVLILGLVGVVVLAYWAGMTRGTHRAQLSLQADVRDLLQPETLAVVTPSGTWASAMQAEKDSQKTGPEHTAASTGQDPRQSGLNYLVLAHYPPEDAQRLVGFLRQHGVEAAAFRPEKSRLFQVIALHAFHKDQIDSPARRDFEKNIRQIGRAWKAAKLGQDFSTSGIYLDLYEGESVAQVIQ